MSERVVVYRWAEVSKHLETLIDAVHKNMENADDEHKLWELKGEARCLRRLLNLPETLTALTE